MHKTGDPVVCVNNQGMSLTVGRTYTVVSVDKAHTRVWNDLGLIGSYDSARFTPLKLDNAGWDYAVADALRKRASDAIDEYNAYIDKQPTTTYYKLHKGF